MFNWIGKKLAGLGNEIESRADSTMWRQANKSNTGARVAFYTLACIAIGVAIGLSICWGVTPAKAHNGKLAADLCHNDRKTGLRHWHIRGSAGVGGYCIEIKGKTFLVFPIEIKKAVARSAPKKAKVKRKAAPTLSKIAAYNRCRAALQIFSDSREHKRCLSIPRNRMLAFLECYKAQTAFSEASKVKHCKEVMGIK